MHMLGLPRAAAACSSVQQCGVQQAACTVTEVAPQLLQWRALLQLILAVGDWGGRVCTGGCEFVSCSNLWLVVVSTDACRLLTGLSPSGGAQNTCMRVECRGFRVPQALLYCFGQQHRVLLLLNTCALCWSG
jgi:hypothetical protein